MTQAPPRPALVVGPEPVVPPGAARTLQEALLKAAADAGGRGTVYVRADGTCERQTYAELLDEGLRVLGGLQELGLRPGDSVLLQCHDNRAFVTGFWACVLGGFLPTPVGEARDYTRENAVTRKLHAAWTLLERPVVLTDRALREPVRSLAAQWGEPAIRAHAVEDLMAHAPGRVEPVTPGQDVLNLLTSGSTGVPKCVRHANRSLVARTYAAIDAGGFTEHDVALNWMPLDHVGGIVMFNVRDVFLRCEHINARTESVVGRPLTWLDLIDRFKATNTWAPNFAFSLVNEHADAIERGSWDLSSLRDICNAGEAVVARTARRFVRLLRPHGLPADAMVPCWGMSETSSGVTYSRLDPDDPAVGTFSVDSATLDTRLVEVPHDSERAVTFTDVGAPVAGVRLRIVDEDGRLLPEGHVGRLHVSGTTLLREYHGNPAANASSFTEDGWFDTGDLGFLLNGRLALTGRSKDMLIVNGANYPSHEVEAVVESVPGVRATWAAACPVRDGDTDGVVVFHVPAEHAPDTLEQDIASTLARDIGLHPRAVVALSEDEFPKTASGKIQRAELATAYAQGRYDRHPDDEADSWLLEPVWEPAPRAGGGTGQDVPARPPAEPLLVYAPEGSALPVALADDTTGPGCPIAVVRAGAPGSPFLTDGALSVTIDPLDAGQHARALDHVAAGLGRVPEHVLHAWEYTADVPGVPDPQGAVTGVLLALRALAAGCPHAKVTVLTRHAAAVGDGDTVDPGRAALGALVRTARAERTVAAVRLVDIAADADDTAAVAAVRGAPAEDVSAVRAGSVVHVQRLRPVPEPGTLAVPREILPPGGTALVTGGLGGIGREVAGHLLSALGARLLLTGRTPEAELTGERRAALEEFRELGDVAYAAVDVADGAALEAAVAAAERRWGRAVDVVLHLAGADVRGQWDALDAHTLTAQTTDGLAAMMRPKAGGAQAVEQLIAGRPGTAVVLFSSVNGFFGGSSFGAYAAANAALDGYAARWAARGRTVRCVAWSMWDGTGMNEGSPLAAAARHRGLRGIDPARGVQLLLAALARPETCLLAGPDPANEHIAPYTTGVRGRGPAGPARAAYSPPEGELEREIAAVWADVLGVDRVGRDDTFFVLGGDSLRVMRMIGRLNERFAASLPVSAVYDHPTVRVLASALAA
ncbi:SDR family NAD(P)-dependent oxidoreductase [Streptomyces sp. enrichment culture]|uniref:SDR family NAD(P)-dependent oxidoreductase n=1 Tax=Streptomyces sp. enrichment culture TaxID=1795815 RepID=UPI003F562FFA